MNTGCCRPEYNFPVTSFSTVSGAFDTCLLSKQMAPNHSAREMLSDRKSCSTVGAGEVLPLTYVQFKVQHVPSFYARPWDLRLFNNVYGDKNSVPIFRSRHSELFFPWQ